MKTLPRRLGGKVNDDDGNTQPSSAQPYLAPLVSTPPSRWPGMWGCLCCCCCYIARVVIACGNNKKLAPALSHQGMRWMQRQPSLFNMDHPPSLPTSYGPSFCSDHSRLDRLSLRGRSLPHCRLYAPPFVVTAVRAEWLRPRHDDANSTLTHTVLTPRASFIDKAHHSS